MSETGQDRTKITIDDYRKLHMRFRLLPKSMTLDDLERPFRTLFQIHAFSEPVTKIWMKIDQYCQRQRRSAVTVVSGNIRFMRIFKWVPCRLKRQWSNRKRRIFWAFGRYVFGILGNEANIILYSLFSPLSPFHGHQNTWPWMTLSGHFTLKFSLLRTAPSNVILHTYRRAYL